MSLLKKTADALSATGSGVASWLKAAVMSRRPAKKTRRPAEEELVILGNGPSLRHTLDHEEAALTRRHRLAVNFAANAPEFFSLRPQFYVLADPHFFSGRATDPNVERLWQNLGRADWPMTLYVPCPQVSAARSALAGTPLRIKGFNLTPGEGAAALVHPLYAAGLAMPRPRNVLIPSIMIGIREGFRRIYIAGADHTWSRTLGVDDQNRVVSVQPHFYKDNAEEQTRVCAEYAGYHLHDILRSLYIAFRSYHQIAAWASRRGVSIYNISPGSYIDAFPRLERMP